uniref:Ig-like domain-containing protein n=1 Tax=Heterorhabditis bacteriophora TaxID=37862 RepID=A0A1I7WUS2_HETBA
MVDLHFLRQHVGSTDLIWVKSHLPHRYLVISESPLCICSNAKCVHGPGSLTPRTIVCYAKVFNSLGSIRRTFNVTIVNRMRGPPIIVPNILMNQTNADVITREDESTLQLTNVTLDDQGIYACITGNSLGSVSNNFVYLNVVMANATLTVNEFLGMVLLTGEPDPEYSTWSIREYTLLMDHSLSISASCDCDVAIVDVESLRSILRIEGVQSETNLSTQSSLVNISEIIIVTFANPKFDRYTFLAHFLR